jgi:hypothetical protein
VGKLAGGAGALYRAGGEGAEAVRVGAGPAAIDGVGSSGGGNGEGKQKGRGEDGAAAPFHFGEGGAVAGRRAGGRR